MSQHRSSDQHASIPPPGPRPEPDASHGLVIGVLGAAGGLGTSTLATAMLVRAAAAGRRAVLVDGHPLSGGLDLLLAAEEHPGLRWPDLAAAQGRVDGAALIAQLPGADGRRVLSWDRRRPPAQPVRPAPIVSSLREAADVVVVDLPRADRPHEWWALCDAIVLVASDALSGVAAGVLVADLASATAAVVSARSPRGLLGGARSGGLGAPQLEALLGVPVLAEIGHDPSVPAALLRGDAVGTGRGAVGDAAERVLAVLLAAEREAA